MSDSVGKKLRFEVFKRDGFKCQYCGAAAPDVILHADHIRPRAEGGASDITNLVTSCQGCNLGKGARLLDDRTVVEKQRKQLEELQERREQLEMMLAWREELIAFEDEKLAVAAHAFTKAAGCSLTETGRDKLKRTLKKYPMDVVLDAIEIATRQYLRPAEGGGFTDESIGKAFDFISRICHVATKEKDAPYLKDLFYIRGIVRKRLRYCDDHKAIELLKNAYLGGASVDSLRNFALDVPNWTQFREGIEAFLAGEGGIEDGEDA